jgi:hypothetical protein
MTHKYSAGTVVKVDGYGDNLFTITEAVTDEEVGDSFYYLDSESLGAFGVDADDSQLTFVMSSEDANKRRIPTAEEIRRGINWLSTDFDSEFEITESYSYLENADVVTLYGKTSEGLRFGTQVKVLNVFAVEN